MVGVSEASSAAQKKGNRQVGQKSGGKGRGRGIADGKGKDKSKRTHKPGQKNGGSDEGNQKAMDPTAVFIRGLPAGTEDRDLRAWFEARIGSTTTCYRIRDDFGLAKFKDPADAARCLHELQGTKLGDSTLRLEAAKPKKRQRQAGTSKPAHAGTIGKSSGWADDDEATDAGDKGGDSAAGLHVRSVQLGGLPGGTSKEVLQKWVEENMRSGCAIVSVRRCREEQAKQRSKKKLRLGSDNAEFVVVFKRESHAKNALQELQGKSLDGNVVSASFRALELSRKTEKAGRLIVRNLNFSATEAQLRKVFKKVGELADVHVPQKSGAAPGVNRGFGFVQYEKRADAERAITELNGAKVCGRGVAVDWAVDAKVYSSMKAESANEDADSQMPHNRAVQPARHPSAAQDVEDDEEDEEEEDEDGEDDDDEGEDRTPTKKVVEAADEVRRMRDFLGDASTAKGGEKVNIESAKPHQARGDKNDAQTSARKPGFDVEDGTTVFVRNIPFEATHEEVKDIFKRYGVVKSVKLTKDPKGENDHRGTGFVKFRDVAGYEAAMAVEAEAERKLKELSAVVRKTDTRELPAVEGFGITLKGRRLVVKKAVTQNEVAEMALQKKPDKEAKKKEKQQWMHLLNVGRIDEHSGEKWDALSKSEKKQRAQSIKERKWRVNNSNFVLDPLRLSVRNLPRSVDVTKLREAVSQHLMTQQEENQTKQERRAEVQKAIQKVSLARSSDRRNVEDNSRRSRGFGFITFGDHKSALKVLEYLNDNPKVFGGLRRPIVEFAVEDKRKLRMQKEMYDKHAHKLLNQEGQSAMQKARKTKKKEGESRGRRQREKRRLQKAAMAERKLARETSLAEKREVRARKRAEENVDRRAPAKRKMRVLPDSNLPAKRRGGELRQGHMADDFELRALERFRKGGR